MPLLSGTYAFLQLLQQEGVDTIFGNPGSTELPLMDALAVEPRMRYILGLQEAAVMGMADGYAQASGRLAVINLHTAPGLGNAMGMLYNAKKAGAPLLVTAGQNNQSFVLTEPILWDDLPRIARPLVKWSAEVQSLADLPRAVHRAAKVALTPPTGPVFLALPANVLEASADIDLQAPSRVAPGWRGDVAALERAAELIASAENPLVFAGDCVAQSRAHRELIALAELVGAPVYAESVASTASFPASHALFAGTIARVAPAVRVVMAHHDLVISIGGDLFTQSLPSNVEVLPPGMKIVHLDTDPWELGKNYPTEAAILGDPKVTLPELTEALERRFAGERRAKAGQRREKVAASIAAARKALIEQAKAEAKLSPLRPLALLHAIGEALPPQAVVIEETHSSGALTANGMRHLIKSDDPQSFYGMRGGCVGWGLPAAIGVKLGLPERPVVALVADGSSLFTCQGLWTAAHYQIGVVFVILNNRSYRILKQRASAMQLPAAKTGKFIAMDLVDPAIDFVGLARSLGVEAVGVRTLPEVLKALKHGIDSGKPLLIDIELDSSI